MECLKYPVLYIQLLRFSELFARQRKGRSKHSTQSIARVWLLLDDSAFNQRQQNSLQMQRKDIANHFEVAVAMHESCFARSVNEHGNCSAQGDK